MKSIRGRAADPAINMRNRAGAISRVRVRVRVDVRRSSALRILASVSRVRVLDVINE